MSTNSIDERRPAFTQSEIREDAIEYGFIGTLQRLKYEYRPDITDRATLEAIFREKFEVVNRVRLANSEFPRLLDEIVTVLVVRRKDLDRETREDWTCIHKTSSTREARRVSAGSASQFNKCQKGCVEEDNEDKSNLTRCMARHSSSNFNSCN